MYLNSIFVYCFFKTNQASVLKRNVSSKKWPIAFVHRIGFTIDKTVKMSWQIIFKYSDQESDSM